MLQAGGVGGGRVLTRCLVTMTAPPMKELRERDGESERVMHERDCEAVNELER